VEKRPKLAVFSPLPPRENGIADYTAEILPLHARDFEVTAVLDDDHPAPGPDRDGIRTVFLAEYLARRDDFADHIHLYHLGNNPDHVYMLPLALERPGVIVLHDVSLHYLLDCATLRWGDFAGYTAALQREYGSLGLLLGRQFETRRWRERAMFYELPVSRTLLDRAKGVVVHSAFAYFKVKAQSPETPVALIPHHLAPVAEAVDPFDRRQVRRARRKLGLDDVELVLLSLGFITKAKQVDAVFRVLAAVRDELPPFRYVLAGGRLPDQFDVDREIARYGLEDVVVVTDYLDEATFFEYIVAADLVINLRYPTGGETSGTLIRALGCGACVVVVDHGPFAELPDDVCVKVPWSPRFGEDLETALLDILRSHDRRRAIGMRARRFLRSRHAIDRSAAAYREALLDAAARPEAPWGVRRPHRFLTLRAREGLYAEFGRPPQGTLWVREAALPEAGEGRLALASDRPALHMEWLARHGYSAGQIVSMPADGQADPAGLVPRGADAALLACPEPGLGAFRRQLAALNGALAFGGVLAVDLLQADFSGSGILATPALIEEEFARAGFSVLHRALGGPSDVSLTADFRSEDAVPDGLFEACWKAVKISEFIAPAESPLARARNGVETPCTA
jgi:glycosyltransferase involved in cell wall biosynthesis